MNRDGNGLPGRHTPFCRVELRHSGIESLNNCYAKSRLLCSVTARRNCLIPDYHDQIQPAGKDDDFNTGADADDRTAAQHLFVVHRYNELQRQLVDAGANIIEPLAVSSEYGMTFHSRESVRQLVSLLHRRHSDIVRAITVFDDKTRFSSPLTITLIRICCACRTALKRRA